MIRVMSSATRYLGLLWVLAGVPVACAPVGEIPEGFEGRGESIGVSATPLPIRPASPCEDRDGDGFGAHCEAGDDCDDGDAQRAEGCEACADHLPGCRCDDGDGPLACDVDTGGEVRPSTCWVGQRSCVDGAWTRCVAYAPRYR